jgi:glyoxylase-like metal-dependent hydrolase (beta-lactamase superfamily II)
MSGSASGGTGGQGKWAYTKGLHDLGDSTYAYLQPDGGWGWSNAGLIVDGDAALLVDTLFDLQLTQEMLDTMRRAVPAARQIGTVVNTHANGDHCWGNELVGGATIIASQRTAEEMLHLAPQAMAGMVAMGPRLGAAGEFAARVFGPFDFSPITLTPPTNTFEGERTLYVGDREVRLIEVGPAHTRGDTLVYLPADRVVFTGDIVFASGHPIVWAGPVGNWIRACERILALDVQTVVPGHGPISDTGAVTRMRDYFAYLAREARASYDAGMTPLEAARDISFADYEAWGEAERIVANIAALYREFRGDAAPPPALEVFAQMAELAQPAG